MVTGVCPGKEDGLIALVEGQAAWPRGPCGRQRVRGSEGQGWGVLATLQRSRGRVSLHTPSLRPSAMATSSLCSGCPICPRGAHLSRLPCGPSPPVGVSLLGCSDDATLLSRLASPPQSVAYSRAHRNRRLREALGALRLTQFPRESGVRWHRTRVFCLHAPTVLLCTGPHNMGDSRVLMSLERAGVLS